MSERTDTERLDWLERYASAEIYRGYGVDGTAFWEASTGVEWFEGETPREAIDAAMDATTEPEEAGDE